VKFPGGLSACAAPEALMIEICSASLLGTPGCSGLKESSISMHTAPGSLNAPAAEHSRVFVSAHWTLRPSSFAAAAGAAYSAAASAPKSRHAPEPPASAVPASKYSHAGGACAASAPSGRSYCWRTHASAHACTVMGPSSASAWALANSPGLVAMRSAPQ
jgi:hypothetical protein